MPPAPAGFSPAPDVPPFCRVCVRRPYRRTHQARKRPLEDPKTPAIDDPPQPRAFVASWLRRFVASSLRASSLRRFVASWLRRFVAGLPGGERLPPDSTRAVSWPPRPSSAVLRTVPQIDASCRAGRAQARPAAQDRRARSAAHRRAHHAHPRVPLSRRPHRLDRASRIGPRRPTPATAPQRQLPSESRPAVVALQRSTAIGSPADSAPLPPENSDHGDRRAPRCSRAASGRHK